MRKLNFLKQILPQFMFIIAASLIVALVPPTPAQAADMAFQDTVQHKIIEYCDENPESDDWNNGSECVILHWGGAQNQLVINQKCFDADEPERCTHEELIGLTINEKFRPKPGNNNSGNNDICNSIIPVFTPECLGQTPGSYPNTTCFTGIGEEMQEKLCPRNAVYPNGDPPSPDKCYASTTTESTGGRDVYEESSCDKSTFTIAPPGEEVPVSEEDEEPKTCEENLDSVLGWIACPVLGAFNDIINTMFDWADGLLSVDGQELYGSEELREVWSYFRVVATFLLLAVAMVMVISQAIGGNG